MCPISSFAHFFAVPKCDYDSLTKIKYANTCRGEINAYLCTRNRETT